MKISPRFESKWQQLYFVYQLVGANSELCARFYLAENNFIPKDLDPRFTVRHLEASLHLKSYLHKRSSLCLEFPYADCCI